MGRARLLAYRCAHFTNGSKSPKVTIIFVPPFRKHIGANVTEIARKASTEGEKKAQKRVCEVCRCGRLARQEAAQIQAGNACSERNTEISEEHRTLNTKSTILSPCSGNFQ